MNKITVTIAIIIISFQCYAQKYDTIPLGLSTAVHLIFEANIKVVHIGLGEQIDASGNKYEDILKEVDSVTMQRLTLTAAVEDFETTNLFVETDNGYFNFILQYAKWPKEHIIPVSDAQAQVKKKIKITQQDLKQAEMKKMEKLQNDSLIELATKALKKRFIDPTIGEKKQKMAVYLNGIYIDGKYIMFRITMKNEGNVKFDIGNQTYQILASERRGVKDKKAIETPEQKSPAFVLNDDVKVVDGKETVSRIYVFEKFTIGDPKKSFAIDIWEKRPGQRIFQVKIPSNDIIRAEPL